MGFAGIIVIPLFLALVVLWLGGCILPFVVIIRNGLLKKRSLNAKKYRKINLFCIVSHAIPLLVMLPLFEDMAVFVVNEVLLLVIQLIMIRVNLHPGKVQNA